MDLKTALVQIKRNYETFKATREIRELQFKKNTEKLAPKFVEQERQGMIEELERQKTNYRASLNEILQNYKKDATKVGLCNTPLTGGQMALLQSLKFMQPSPEEYALLAQDALKEHDMLFLRALKNTAEADGVTLAGLPMNADEGSKRLESVIKVASRIIDSDDQGMDEIGLFDSMENLADRASMYNNDGSLKEITGYRTPTTIEESMVASAIEAGLNV